MSADSLIGCQLANYRLERVIGRGAMAQVYFGWDVRLQRPVAVKVIDIRHRGNPAYARRFVREAEVVAALRHENIVQIYYAGDEDSLYYFVMEYVDGLDLATLLASYASDGELMPHPDVLHIGRATAAALDAAHARGVIHRDVKPSNVLVTGAGRVVLGDFGLAMDAQQGSIGEAFGTAQYVAPEQANNSADAVPQSDLYSLGVILYEMLAGTLPFDDASPMSLALQHMTLPPPAPREFNPTLNEATNTVLLKTLSKSPADRYATGDALLSALEKALSADPAVPPDLPDSDVASRKGERTLSQRPVAYMVAQHMESVDRPSLGLPPAAVVPGMRAASARRHALIGLIIGGILMALTAMLFGVGAIFALNREGGAAAVPTRQVPAISHDTTNTPEPSTPAASQAAPNAGPTQAPDVAGRRFVILYNESSLYLLNLSGSDSPIGPLAFERLDAEGQPVSQFDGERWARFFPTIMPGACMRIEIIGHTYSSYLRPPECHNRYNSTRTPNPGDAGIVWTLQEGSSQFRVLWNDVEAGRCEIAAGSCEVFLP